MAIFFNQASLSFNGYVTNSNVTSGEVLEVISVTKSSLSETYNPNGSIAYIISITNSSTNAISGITVTDDLGAYTSNGEVFTPLEYTDGSIRYYVGGVLEEAPEVNAGPPLVISGISVPANSTVLLIYEARPTSAAPITLGSSITNTASVSATAPCLEGPVTASATVEVDGFTSLSIAKSVSPDIVTGCDELTYTFVIQNAGNEAVVATDDLIVRDTFVPALSDIVVTFNGESWTEGVNYTYDAETGLFETLPGQITVPAAIFTQDAETGVVTTTPGASVLTVSGTL